MARANPTPEIPELHRPIDVSEMRSGDERSLEIRATDAERRALAQRFGLLDLACLEASVRLERSAEGVRVSLDIQADATQSCVVSLEPVDAHVVDHVDLVFAEHAEAPEVREVFTDLVEQDPPELLIDGTIDVGEAVAEYFGLALDPYPRRPGASFTGLEGDGDQPGGGAFAALRRLKS